MSISTAPTPTSTDAPPRRWPILLLVLLGAGGYIGSRLAAATDLEPEKLQIIFMAGVMGPMACTVLLALYWITLGAGRFWGRLMTVLAGAAVASVAVLLATQNTRMWVIWWGAPLAAAVVAVFGVLFARAAPGVRYLGGTILGLAALVPWLLIHVNGVWGAFKIDWQPRWAKGADAATDLENTGEAVTLPAEVTANDWPGFRGAARNGVSPAKLGAISASALKERWRINVGPGWGSMCVVGDYLYTQDQLPTEERIACYNTDTGKRVWSHTYAARHEDWASASGPRATPTYHDKRVYAFGAKGDLVCVHAETGKEVWTVKLTEMGETKNPDFGFSASPFVANDRVYIHPGWRDGPRLVCFEAKTGKQVFAKGEGGNGYSSPHLATLAGVEQVLIFNDRGLFGHDAKSGKELWEYSWKAGQSNPSSNQPLLLSGDRVLLGGGGIGQGTQCIQIKRAGESWTAERLWRSTRFTPNFNDVVQHGEVIYGLDRTRLFCAEVATGEVRWFQKDEEKFGTGQLLLLADALLVLGERGGITLLPLPLEQDSKGIDVPALKGKTWNHPAVANGRLFVRNGRKMVCFDLVKNAE